MTENAYEGWAIVELMGHRRLAGRVTPAVLGGAAVLRIDVPRGDEFVTQFYSGSSLYALTPTTEEIARAVAKGAQPEPVSLWELRALPAAASTQGPTGEDDDGAFDGDERGRGSDRF